MKKFAQEKIVILLTTIPVKFICLFLFFTLSFSVLFMVNRKLILLKQNLLNIIDIPEMILQKDR